MSDLVLGPVVGKLGGGGAEVHTIPVDFVSSSGTGVKHVVDVPVPEGVAARVIVVGMAGVTNTSNSSWPSLIIGGQEIGRYYSSVGGSATVTGPTVVEANRRSTSSLYDPSFNGFVYWWTEGTGDPGGGGDPGEGVTTVPVGTLTGTDKTIHTVVLDRPSIVSAHLTGFIEMEGMTTRWAPPAPSIEVRPPSGGVWGETRFGRSLIVHEDGIPPIPAEMQTQNARYLSISATLPAGEYHIVINTQSASRTYTVDTATITVTPQE